MRHGDYKFFGPAAMAPSGSTVTVARGIPGAGPEPAGPLSLTG